MNGHWTKHKTQTENQIEAPLPAIFTINLEWPVERKKDTAASILRILFAIPEVWNTKDLYVTGNADTVSNYQFKGLICKEKTGHHISYFRRTRIKNDVFT